MWKDKNEIRNKCLFIYKSWFLYLGIPFFILIIHTNFDIYYMYTNPHTVLGWNFTQFQIRIYIAFLSNKIKNLDIKLKNICLPIPEIRGQIIRGDNFQKSKKFRGVFHKVSSNFNKPVRGWGVKQSTNAGVRYITGIYMSLQNILPYNIPYDHLYRYV